MGLKAEDRGLLEKIIDREITGIEKFITTWRSPQYKQVFQIKDPDEFAYGYAQGAIISKFEVAYSMMYAGKKMTDEELSEISEIILKRSREIKEAIFKSG